MKNTIKDVTTRHAVRLPFRWSCRLIVLYFLKDPTPPLQTLVAFWPSSNRQQTALNPSLPPPPLPLYPLMSLFLFFLLIPVKNDAAKTSQPDGVSSSSNGLGKFQTDSHPSIHPSHLSFPSFSLGLSGEEEFRVACLPKQTRGTSDRQLWRLIVRQGSRPGSGVYQQELIWMLMMPNGPLWCRQFGTEKKQPTVLWKVHVSLGFEQKCCGKPSSLYYSRRSNPVLAYAVRGRVRPQPRE